MLKMQNILIVVALLFFSKAGLSKDFKKGTIKIKNITLNTEFAITDAEQQLGLMNRTELPDNFGMLFIFENNDYRAFWMKDTFVDLSIAYIGADKKINEILDMKAVTSSTDLNTPSYPSKEKAMYALEVRQGWFKKNKIKVGDKIKDINIKK
ncbi:MAG: DUF192 domain-containing protein [Bdellovibrionaceae bacterium]|nr:DUF192 domain-containing protein [Pseudobdellovibrionaceae bacterium]